MSLQNWVADNRAFPSLLPKPRVATKADLARPNTHEPETLRQPGGPATHCYLCCEEWRDHLTNEEEEEENVGPEENATNLIDDSDEILL